MELEQPETAKNKLSIPRLPIRYCKRCGTLVTWGEPEGFEYDEANGQPLIIRVQGTCPCRPEKENNADGGLFHFKRTLYWPTKKINEAFEGHGTIDPERWWAHAPDYRGLRPYADIQELEAFVRSKSNGVDMYEEPKKPDVDPTGMPKGCSQVTSPRQAPLSIDDLLKRSIDNLNPIVKKWAQDDDDEIPF